MTVDLAMLIHDEPQNTIIRSLRLALAAYPNVPNVLICRRAASQEMPDIGREIILFDRDNTEHLFSSYVDVFRRFSEQSTSEFLVVLDPDTIVIKHDGIRHDVAGPFVHYRNHKIREFLEVAPEEWRRHFPGVLRLGALHSVQGSWWWLSRRAVNRILDEVPNKNLRLSNGMIFGSEVFLGLCLRQARKKAKQEGRPFRERVTHWEGPTALHFYNGLDRAGKHLVNMHTFHPVKTDKDWNDLLQRLPPRLKEDLISRAST